MLNIRKVIQKNRLYAWMLVIIILVQSYGVFIHRIGSTKTESRAKSAISFLQEMENNRRLLQRALTQNTHLAVNFAYIAFFLLIIFLVGNIFLVGFLTEKIKRKEPIPKTQQDYAVAWGWSDAVRVIVIFLFINHMSFLFEYILVQFLKSTAQDERASMVLDTLFMDLLVILFVMYFVSVKYKQNIAALGISGKNIIKNIGIALFGYAAFLPILAIVFVSTYIVVKLLNYTPPPEPIYDLIFKEKRTYLLAVISTMVVFIGPITEEIFFRGFLYAALRKGLNVWAAMIISSVIFSLLHTNIVGFLPIVILGMFLAYLREKTGSLVPSICVHIMHNSALAGLMFFMRYAISIS